MKVKATKRRLELSLSPREVATLRDLLGAVARTDWKDPKAVNMARYLMGIVEGFTDETVDLLATEDEESSVYAQGREDGDPYRHERERAAERMAQARLHGLGAPEGGP